MDRKAQSSTQLDRVQPIANVAEQIEQADARARRERQELASREQAAIEHAEAQEQKRVEAAAAQQQAVDIQMESTIATAEIEGERLRRDRTNTAMLWIAGGLTFGILIALLCSGGTTMEE